MRGRGMKLRFRKPEAGQKLKEAPEIILETGTSNKLKDVFQEYAERQVLGTPLCKTEDADLGGKEWERFKFMAMGQPMYLSPDHNPRESQLFDGHIIRVSEARKSRDRAAAAGVRQPESKKYEEQVKKPSHGKGLSADEHRDEGNSQYKQGNYLQAAVCYTDAILAEKEEEKKGVQVERKCHVLYSNRSAAYLELSKTVEKEELQEMLKLRALRDAMKCNSLKSNWSKGFYRMGCALEAVGFPDKALSQLNTAVTIDPANKDFREKRDQLEKKRTGELVLDDKYQKDPYISKAKEIQPESASDSDLQMDLFWLEQLIQYRQYWDEGCKALGQEAHASAQSLKEEGNILFARKKFLKAAKCYTQDIRRDPLDAVLHSNRSVSYLEAARDATDKELRKQFMLKAFRDSTWCTEAKIKWDKGYVRLGAVLEELGFPSIAWSSFKDAVTRNPGNEEASRRLANYRRAPPKSELYSPEFYGDKDINFHREVGRSMPSPGDIEAELTWLQGLLQAEEKPVLELGSTSMCRVVLDGTRRSLNWVEGTEEGERYRWLWECFRLREGMDEWSLNSCPHQIGCSCISVLSLLFFCKLLRTKRALPRTWDWSRFLSSHPGEKTLAALQKLKPNEAVALYGSGVVGVSRPPGPASMVAAAAFLYGCGAGEPWPVMTLLFREVVEQSFLGWLEDKDERAFIDVGGVEAWKSLLQDEVQSRTCAC